MPIFQSLMDEYTSAQPLNGIKIGIVHVYAPNTVPMLQTMINGGAEIEIILNNGMQHDYEIVEHLKTTEVTSLENLPENRVYNYIIDCGGYFTNYPPEKGGVEVTKTGIHRFEKGFAGYKLIDVDDTKVKLIETFIGNPEGVVLTLNHFIGDAQFFLEDANVAVIGFGKIGRGSARKLMEYTNQVTIFDISDQVLAFASSLEFQTVKIMNDVENNSEQIKNMDLVITSTGQEGIMTRYFQKKYLKNTLKINLGAVDEWGDAYSEEEIFHSKHKPFNFNLQPPTPSKYIDPILALQVEALVYLVQNEEKLIKGINPTPIDLENEIFEKFFEIHSDEKVDDFKKYFPHLF